jgi:spore germination protein YaaH
MDKILRVTAIVLIVLQSVYSQKKSIHQSESEYFSNNPNKIEQFGKINTNQFLKPLSLNKAEALSYKVYGFHPYWISDATAANYYYSLLSHVAYFSAEVDTSTSTTGGIKTSHSWSSTQVVTYCKEHNIKVHLAVTMFANHSRVLANATYRTNLVNNIFSLVQSRGADGANIDFESVPSGEAADFRLFINELGTKLKENSLELAICIPAVDWSSIYTSTFTAANNSVVDYYFLMAYDYYYSGSSTAGPVSPLTTGTSVRHFSRSINAYISAGMPASKLIAGCAYYGYDWKVVSSTRMASVVSGTDGSSSTYSTIAANLPSINDTNKFFDNVYNVPWYRYNDGTDWHQVWYDDSASISMKYDTLKAKGLAGAGMWALSYDGSKTAMWGALKKAFTTTVDPSFTELADFESSSGVFYSTPTTSGSTRGIDVSSTSAWSVQEAKNGSGSLKVVLKDSSGSSNAWTVRLLSGGGTPANNITLGSSGYAGLWLKTSSAPTGAQIAITVDDGAGGTELSPKLSVSNTGTWTLYQWNLQSAGWSSFAGGNGVINGPTATLDAVMFYAPNNSSDWTMYLDDVAYNPSGTLPVQLDVFKAYSYKNKVKLEWNTATEKDNYGFEIERCLFGDKMPAAGNWEKAGFVKGSGNSNSPKAYSFIDDQIKYSGKYYYRLKQIDTDGRFEYSKIAEVQVDLTPGDFQLFQNYPNPFNPVTIIKYSLPVESKVRIILYNSIGREVKELVNISRAAGNYEVSFNAVNLSSGVYFYQLIATSLDGKQNYKSIKKMMLLH